MNDPARTGTKRKGEALEGPESLTIEKRLRAAEGKLATCTAGVARLKNDLVAREAEVGRTKDKLAAREAEEALAKEMVDDLQRELFLKRSITFIDDMVTKLADSTRTSITHLCSTTRDRATFTENDLAEAQARARAIGKAWKGLEEAGYAPEDDRYLAELLAAGLPGLPH